MSDAPRVWASIAELARSVRFGEITALELVEKSLTIIDSKQEFNAIIATTSDRARERAQVIDAGDKTGRLCGVPFIAKDNFLVFGAETTAASNMLCGFNAPYQSSAIERLEAEGAICVAKANLDAFAHGSSTENSDFGVTLHPLDTSRVPGGSSGGSAAAVVLEMAPFALGSDTGGSIRLPASFCGAVGYKPTYGLVSRSGVVAMASSTDVIGPLTRTVSDAALVLDVMSGIDPLDSTTIAKDALGYELKNEEHKTYKIGVVKEYMGEGMDASVRTQIERAIDAIKAAGHDVVDVSLPSLPAALAVYYVLCPAEVSSNLSRYDGQRFGHTYPNAQTLTESYSKSRSTGFGKEAKRRIMIGTYVLSSGYYDAYYKKAQIVRTKLINEANEAFSKVNFIVGPTVPTTAFEIGQNTADPLQMYLVDILTVAANLIGIPAISIPAGLANGLPVGLQVMAAQHKDRELLKLSKQIEELVG